MTITKNIPEISGIYKITNTVNNKCYIGQAVNLRSRIKGHLSCIKKNYNYPLYHSIRKHNVENFELEILVQGNFSKTELNDLEIDFIRLYNSIDRLYGYNLTAGGEGVVGLKHSQKTKEKIGKLSKGRKHSEETKKLIGLKSKGRNLGYKHSEETKEKFRQAKIGKKLSKEHREKISKIHKGKITSQETKEKMRKSSLGKITSEETKNKQRDIKLGKKLTPESIEKRTRTQKLNKFKKQLTELFYNELMKI